MAKKDKGKKKELNSPGSESSEELLRRLNAALSLEYAACIQYLQQQSLVKGQDRHDFAPFFAASSAEAHLHAQNLGNKIVSLGGIPTVEPEQVRQATVLREMLINDLEMERAALEAYIRSWEAAENHLALRFWLEDIIRQEQLHVDELEKLTARQGAG
ncbi:MAG: ferritin-like domain-containing protein [Acidobacteriota bacterium]|nr:MAG: ferritin-like domain-containing protein [Acidobacteriota bacterium]